MATVQYIAVMEGGGNAYGVWFPDLPGCVSAGETEQEARRGAAEALGLHLQGMVEDGEALPTPSGIHAFGPKDVGPEFLYLFIVDASAPEAIAPKILRVNITLPEPLVQRIDQAAGGNRSAWLADAAREKLERRPALRADLHEGQSTRRS
jgi:predicted RNase H-like HicB family nuclease